MANGWTAERRAKHSAAIRQWQPWKQSTGPKTDQGKDISSKNSYKGGNRLLLRDIAAMLRDQKNDLDLIL